jgi:hypothetical protein
MKFVLVDIDSFVIDIKTWTPEEYGLLDPATQAQYTAHEDSEDIQIGYKALDDGTFLSIEQQKDLAFAEDPTAYKERLCDRLDAQLSAVMAHGFEYQGKRYNGDERSQLWASAYLTMITAGTTIDIGWIAQDNTVTQMTAAEFGAFVNAFLSWGQTTVFTFFNAKLQIRGATTRAAADTLFEAAPKP